ncbi:MAG: hypothetical protein HPY65_13640 [Syntrophaceae bacterium]|nr:hypothetical protein [Syntrophaceae bacterium]
MVKGSDVKEKKDGTVVIIGTDKGKSSRTNDSLGGYRERKADPVMDTIPPPPPPSEKNEK